MLNGFQLEGYLASEPVEKATEFGTSVFYLLLACKRDLTEKNKKRITDFIRLAAPGKTGEIIKKYVAVGQHLVVRGRIKSFKVRRNGKEYVHTELVVEKPYFDKADNVLSAEEMDFVSEERSDLDTYSDMEEEP